MDKRKFKFPVGGMTIIGHSRSAEMTGFFIPETGWALDVGTSFGAHQVYHAFITHGHLDHSIMIIEIIPFVGSHRNLVVWCDEKIQKYVANYIETSQMLNDSLDVPHKRPYSLRQVTIGETYDIPGKVKYTVTPVRCDHTVPSVGYCFDEKREKLKKDYSHMTGYEIAKLRTSGVNVTETVLIPLFVFMGDTTTEVYKNYPQVFHYPVILTECTFIDGTIEEAKSKGHTTWEILKPIVLAHPTITFILIHFSMRYSNEDILNFFKSENLPNVLPWVDEKE